MKAAEMEALEGPLQRHEISQDDHPLSLGSKSVWHQFFQVLILKSFWPVFNSCLNPFGCFSWLRTNHCVQAVRASCWWLQDTELAEQINRDVKRPHPDMQFFCGDNDFARENQVLSFFWSIIVNFSILTWISSLYRLLLKSTVSLLMSVPSVRWSARVWIVTMFDFKFCLFLVFGDSWLQVQIFLWPWKVGTYSPVCCLLLLTSSEHAKQEALKRILFIFAKLNPGIRYVQGMNEVLAPLYYVFKTDVDEANVVRTISVLPRMTVIYRSSLFLCLLHPHYAKTRICIAVTDSNGWVPLHATDSATLMRRNMKGLQSWHVLWCSDSCRGRFVFLLCGAAERFQRSFLSTTWQ